MNIRLHPRRRQEGFTLIAYLIFALIITGTIAAIASYVIQNVNYGKRRQDFVNAYQFAQGGAVIACRDIESAFTNSAGLLASLAQSCCGSYTTNTGQSSASQLVIQRTISSPFSNQTVAVQLKMTNSATPESIKVLATAAVGNSSQTVEINLDLQFAFGAAIISTAPGSSCTSATKSCGQDGNVVVDGGGVTMVEGGILSNGAANSNRCVIDSLDKNLYGTASQIPDYTSPGSSDQLFDFDRFIAVADATPGGKNHFTNLTAFVAEAATKTLEGVVVVDIPYGSSIPNLDTKSLPLGINVRGTLVFNFCKNAKGQNWDPLDKIINTATMNINAADLSSLNATNPATYPTGYPPVYTDSTKNPINVTLPAGSPYSPFTAADDLPALMYNNAILDMHGNVNICGVVYSSSFMEIENKQGGATQYFNGALIGGGGIYVENGQGDSISIVKYDPNALDRLATSGTRGKTVKVTYQR